MLKAVLFDLDGTLLPLDLDPFMQDYFKHLSDHFAHLYEPKAFQGYVWEATKAMVKDNRADKTNEQVFMEAFLPMVNHTQEQLLPMFDHFYSTKFNELKHCTTPTPLAKKVVAAVIEKGYPVVLATNPMFPAIATQARMRWAGIEDLPWELVTTYENSHYCKPNPAYFSEILEKLNVAPSEVLLVGNDTTEDLVASKLGIKTYLVTDHLIDRGDSPFKPDASGTLEEFYQLAKQGFDGVF
ncbi:HAD family hydrolase [Peptococcaceae bacterium 1198_IL3148]